MRSRPIRASSDTVDGYPHRAWTDASGETVVEEYVITGMAHGTPLAVGNDENSYGAAGPFLLDVGISSSYRIAQFWGLTESSVDDVQKPADERPVSRKAYEGYPIVVSAPEVQKPEVQEPELQEPEILELSGRSPRRRPRRTPRTAAANPRHRISISARSSPRLSEPQD